MAVLPPDPVFCFKGDMGYIHSLCFSIQNESYCSQLLAATEKGVVHFWDLETNRLQHKQTMGESIQAVHYVDHNIITQEKSGLVKLWSIRKSSYEVTNTYDAGGGYYKSILINNSLVVAQDNGEVDVLDADDLTKVRRLVPDREQLGRVMSLQEVEVGGNICILAGYESGDVIVWDLDSTKACGHVKLQENLMSITYDPVSQRGVCGGTSNILQLFTIDKSFNMSVKCEVSITNEGCNVVKFRPHDSKIFVTAGWDGRLRVFSCKSLRILVVLAEHKGPVTDVQFSPNIVNYWNSRIMAASGADGTITLWNLYN